LSCKLKDKEQEIDINRNRCEIQMDETEQERDIAVKESKLLREKLTDLLQHKQENETKSIMQIQSYENK